MKGSGFKRENKQKNVIVPGRITKQEIKNRKQYKLLEDKGIEVQCNSNHTKGWTVQNSLSNTAGVMRDYLWAQLSSIPQMTAFTEGEPLCSSRQEQILPMERIL